MFRAVLPLRDRAKTKAGRKFDAE